MERQLEELKAQMEKSSEALAQFERELNVINPEEKTNILSARLLQLNTEYTKAQADRVTQGSGLQLGAKAARWSRAGVHARRGAQEADREPERGAAEVRRGEEALRRESSRVQEGAGAGRRDPAADRRPRAPASPSASRSNITKRSNRESMLEQAVKETKAEFDRPERALLRIPDAEARGRWRQEAV